MKRIISAVIACAVLLSQTAVFAFTDVDSSHWAYGSIDYISSTGALSGYEDGTFRPENAVTRAEFCKIITEFFDLPTVSGAANYYPDIDASAWYEPYILCADYYMPTYEDGTFRPTGDLSRFEAAYTLVALYNLKGEYDTSVMYTYADIADFVNDDFIIKYSAAAVATGIMTGLDGNVFAPYQSLTRAQLCALLERVVSGRDMPDVSEVWIYADGVEQSADTSDAVSDAEHEVLELVNQIRTEYGLGTLTWDDDNAAVARAKSEDMRDRGYFDHISPDGTTPADRLTAAGVSFRGCAENIAAGQTTAAQVVNSWMNSEGHRKNILNSSYTKLGVGVASGGEYGVYWTQIFTY